MIKSRILTSKDMLSAERDDFGFYDPHYTKIEESLRHSPYPMRSLNWCCSSIKNGLTPAKDQYSVEPNETDALIIKVANLTNSGIDFSEEKLSFVSREVFDARNQAAQAKVGDVLVLCAAHQRRYIGKRVDIIESLPEGYENRSTIVAELLILRTYLERVEPYYLLACLRLPSIQELVNKYVRGQTGHLYPGDLKKLQIPVPDSIETQRAIAETIYAADKKAKELRKEILRAESYAANVLANDIYKGLSNEERQITIPALLS